VLTAERETEITTDRSVLAGISGPRAAVAGAIASLVALATGELVAALLDSEPSLVTAVGSSFIDRFAASLKDIAVAVFGTNDKVALIVGIVIVTTGLGAAAGVASRHWAPAAPLTITAAGLAGGWALATDPQGTVGTAVASCVVSVGAGLAAFALLWRSASDRRAPIAINPEQPGAAEPAPPAGRGSRRQFVVAAGGLVAAAGVSTALARRIRSGNSISAERRSTVLPRPRRTVPVPSGATLDVPGVTPYVTSNADFYRIDTALTVPQIAAADWRLSVTGLVDRPFELTYDALLEMDTVEVPVTLLCVSNEVGGNLIGNAVWQGVPLADVLERAGPLADAAQVVGRSVDGFTAGFPLPDALDGRTALVAFGMNGEPLPAAHGYPARLVVAGLYGYVSATKWLREIELTTWDAFDGYWVPRGWSKRGPVKTQSRIDVPAGTIDPGRVAIAGVAWAPGRGIERVEVQVDEGDWQQAELADVASDETWRAWRLAWDATSGTHRLRVRATDGTGETQTPDEQPPAPDGATGWHGRTVTVR
jgi:DMSO/TMAO reductase YedYZ molybdopterin-dependent catalytic subunit